MLSVAASVAQAFSDRGELSGAELDAATKSGLPGGGDHGQVIDTRQALRRLGYIWKPPGQRLFEAGIPSLMAHMQEGMERK